MSVSLRNTPLPDAPSALESGRNSGRPFIRLARFEDYDQIAALEARHGLTVKPRKQWLDLWQDNPTFLALDDWPIGWVIEDVKGNLVGSLGNVPMAVYLGGKSYISAAGRGWAVDPQYRAYSVMLLAHQIKQSLADMNVITTPSPTTVALCTQLGWSRVPVGEWDRSQFWIVDHRKALQSYLESKTPAIVANVATALASPLLFVKDVMAERRYSPASGYRLDWCDSFDERFDWFWKEINKQYPDRLLPARDTATLQWHFKSALQERRLWILAASVDSRMVGYAVLDRRDIAALDLTRVLLQDFQALTPDAALCSSMIHALLQRCRRDGIHILENVGCWMEKLQPLRSAPYRRHLGSWCYLYRIKNESLERSLRRAASWYPTQYDGDASI